MGQVVQRRSGAQRKDTSRLTEAESFIFARLLSNIGQSLPLALRGPQPHGIPDQHDYLITVVYNKGGKMNNIA